jgi:hypothetical protein
VIFCPPTIRASTFSLVHAWLLACTTQVDMNISSVVCISVHMPAHTVL